MSIATAENRSLEIGVAVTKQGEQNRAAGAWSKADSIAVLICTAACAVALSFWYLLDHRVPGADESGHILSALTYADLLRHPKFWQIAWLHQFMSVNSFYPPFVYVFNGVLKLLLGGGRAVDAVGMVLFAALLTYSTYGIARLLTRSTAVAVTATIVLNLYPQIVHLSHVYLLDFPLVAMVAVGLLGLLWWQERPSWPRAILAGCLLAAACMSKQIAAGFLFLPGCLCLWQAVVADRRQANFQRTRQVLAMAAMVLAAFAPWLLVNFSWIQNYARENSATMGGLGVKLTPGALFADYLLGLWYSMSPLLALLFLGSTLLIGLEQHRRLLPLYLAAIGGLTAISVLTCTFPLDRYAAAALILTAVVTACGLVRCLAAGKTAVPVVGALAAVAVLQTISFAFCPSPLGTPWVTSAASRLGVYLREFRGVKVERSVPSPASTDWGQQWVIDSIKKSDHNNVAWLNILPSHGAYNPHSFELLAKECKANVRPTTSRYWTIMGDKVSFSPHTAMYYQWYLLKTGDQGNQLCDAVSEDNYTKLMEFVTSGAHYHLQGRRQVADGSTISLYKLIAY